jgi:hypothetical protein
LTKRFALALLAFIVLLPIDVTPQKAGSHTVPSSKAGSSKSTKSDRTVHVKKHKRKDGTIVKAHDRVASRTRTKSAPSKKVSAGPPTRIPKKSTVAVRDAHGRIARSAAARKTFMMQTGYPKGRPGYIVDHALPLECGGADVPSNMQWQTVQEAKIKDRTERNCRRE